MLGIRKKNKKQFTITIIGAGSIGANKPNKYDSPKTKAVLTIAHAAYNNPRIKILSFVDSDKNKLDSAINKWGGVGIYDVKDIPVGASDIIAVCTPTETHYEVLKEVIKKKPKIIIAEKPFCSSSKEAKKIIELCEKNKIQLIIDYIRFYDVVSSAVWAGLSYQSAIYNVVVTYTRGFIHEACHAIQLMNKWLGACTEVKILQSLIDDRSEEDFSSVVYCRHNYIPVVYMPVDGRNHSIFEITIHTSSGKYVFSDHGKVVKIQGLEKEKTYGDYKSLEEAETKIGTELTTALESMMERCCEILEGHSPSVCSGGEASEVHSVLDMYKKELKKKGR